MFLILQRLYISIVLIQKILHIVYNKYLNFNKFYHNVVLFYYIKNLFVHVKRYLKHCSKYVVNQTKKH